MAFKIAKSTKEERLSSKGGLKAMIELARWFPGIDFGTNAEGYLRFSYANSVENIEEGLRRLGSYLEGCDPAP